MLKHIGLNVIIFNWIINALIIFLPLIFMVNIDRTNIKKLFESSHFKYVKGF